MVPGRSLADEVERRGTTVSEDADALVLTARRVLCMAAISEAVIDSGQMKPTATTPLRPTQRFFRELTRPLAPKTDERDFPGRRGTHESLKSREGTAPDRLRFVHVGQPGRMRAPTGTPGQRLGKQVIRDRPPALV